MNTHDYDQDLRSVMRQERLSYPLSVQDSERLFGVWRDANPSAMRALEGHARYLGVKGMVVSAKYLVEWLRYETTIKPVPVPFYDHQGRRHEFRFNNNHTALLGRHLKAKYPELRVTMRQSAHDEEVAA